MHRRLQLGVRENPASERRHGSRVAVASSTDDHFGKDYAAGPPPVRPGQNQLRVGIYAAPNAAYDAATGGERSVSGREEPVHATVPTTRSEPFEPLIGSLQAARLLGNIHVKTLQRYARLGRLPGYQIGGHWYFRESELDAWLRHQINSNRQSVR